MKAYGGVEIQLHSLLTATLHGAKLYNPDRERERARPFPFNGKTDGPQGWSGLLSLPGIEPRFLSYPTRNRHSTANFIATPNLRLAFLYYQWSKNCHQIMCYTDSTMRNAVLFNPA
jgi:hypothetical protein